MLRFILSKTRLSCFMWKEDFVTLRVEVALVDGISEI